MTRLTDNDRRFGPLTWGKTDSYRPLRLTFCTGGNGDDDSPRNSLTAWAFGRVLRLSLPTLMQPYRIKHIAESWDAATVARMGRNWYFETHPREYGFSVSDGFLQVFLGPQTHDSTTTKSWSKFLPWTQWRHVRHSFYDAAGEHFWTEPQRVGRWKEGEWEEMDRQRSACPTVTFTITDYDGAVIQATTRIEEREWHFGEGWFRWLSLLRRPMVKRSLDIHFGAEVGTQKGSWKGGLIGTSIEMLPGELHADAFRRYCAQEHRDKGGRYRITLNAA